MVFEIKVFVRLLFLSYQFEIEDIFIILILGNENIFIIYWILNYGLLS